MEEKRDDGPLNVVCSREEGDRTLGSWNWKLGKRVKVAHWFPG